MCHPSTRRIIALTSPTHGGFHSLVRSELSTQSPLPAWPGLSPHGRTSPERRSAPQQYNFRASIGCGVYSDIDIESCGRLTAVDIQLPKEARNDSKDAKVRRMATPVFVVVLIRAPSTRRTPASFCLFLKVVDKVQTHPLSPHHPSVTLTSFQDALF